MSMSQPSEQSALVKDLRAPAAAGIAGLIFSVILLAVIILMRVYLPHEAAQGNWLDDPTRRRAVSTAMALIPFAGISFLWFIGVVRTRLGALEDQLFATVLLGSGLLFVAMLFTTAAMLASALTLYHEGAAGTSEVIRALQILTSELMGTFGARMAAVFAISVTTIGLRTGLVPRWLVLIGYVTGLTLLLSPPLTPWVQLAFPTWVMLLSIHILVVSRPGRARASEWTMEPPK